MSSKEECECVKNMMDTLVVAFDLSKSAKTSLSRNSNIIYTDLEKVLNSKGKDIIAATTAGDRFHSFILDNGARMIRCPRT